MPTESNKRNPRLRRDENPPYPEYVFEWIRPVLEMQKDIGCMTEAVGTLKGKMEEHTEKLGKINGKLVEIDGHVNKFKGVIWFVSIASPLIVAAFELYAYFHPHVPR
jgi:hypothetical protein